MWHIKLLHSGVSFEEFYDGYLAVQEPPIGAQSLNAEPVSKKINVDLDILSGYLGTVILKHFLKMSLL